MTTSALTVEDSDDSTSGETVSETVEYKYAQLEIPNFQLDGSGSSMSYTDAGGSTKSYAPSGSATGGNSFVRLGSFPKITATTTVAKDGTSSTSTTLGDDAPAGFQNSLDLAFLVGQAGAIASLESSDSAPDDGDVIRKSVYHGDGNYFLGFADDTRRRTNDVSPTLSEDDKEKTYIDWTEVDNDMSTRLTETKRLLTKGGWWDHSDGNRITTTSGDKIEVIQGNYKMVILGRQDPTDASSGRAAVTDFSGGLFTEQAASPTPCIKSTEWVTTEDGQWSLFQDNGYGNVTTKFHGKQVDLYTGTYKESVIGSGGSPDDDPELVSKTWASKIESYVGSADHPIPHLYSLTYAKFKNDVTFGYTVSATTSAVSVASATLAGAEILQVGIAPFMANVLLTVQNIDYKAGFTYTIHDFKTGLFFKKTNVGLQQADMHVTREELSGVLSRVNGVEQSLAGQGTNIEQARTSISTTHTELSVVDARIAAMHELN